jgi:hypothetical protein
MRVRSLREMQAQGRHAGGRGARCERGNARARRREPALGQSKSQLPSSQVGRPSGVSLRNRARGLSLGALFTSKAFVAGTIRVVPHAANRTHSETNVQHDDHGSLNKTDATIRVSGRSLVTSKPAVIGGGGYEGWSPQSVRLWWPCTCCSTKLVTPLCSHLQGVCGRDHEGYDCPHGVACARHDGSARTEPNVSRRQNARETSEKACSEAIAHSRGAFSKYLERRLELRGNPQCG